MLQPEKNLVILCQVYCNEGALLPKAHEEAEEDWVEKDEADSQDVLMHYCRHSEDQKHACSQKCLLRHLSGGGVGKES